MRHGGRFYTSAVSFGSDRVCFLGRIRGTVRRIGKDQMVCAGGKGYVPAQIDDGIGGRSIDGRN